MSLIDSDAKILNLVETVCSAVLAGFRPVLFLLDIFPVIPSFAADTLLD